MPLPDSRCLYLAADVSTWHGCLYLAADVSIWHRCLYLAAGVYTWQQVSLPGSSCLYLAAVVSTWQQLSLPGSNCLYLAAVVSSQPIDEKPKSSCLFFVLALLQIASKARWPKPLPLTCSCCLLKCVAWKRRLRERMFAVARRKANLVCLSRPNCLAVCMKVCPRPLKEKPSFSFSCCLFVVCWPRRKLPRNLLVQTPPFNLFQKIFHNAGLEKLSA
jgi:hypothetical protein